MLPFNFAFRGELLFLTLTSESEASDPLSVPGLLPQALGLQRPRPKLAGDHPSGEGWLGAGRNGKIGGDDSAAFCDGVYYIVRCSYFLYSFVHTIRILSLATAGLIISR